jgi:hypothetical protein
MAQPDGFEAAGELVWCGPSSLIRGGRCDISTDFAGCADERRIGAASWAGQLAPNAWPCDSTPSGLLPATAPPAGSRRRPAFSGGGFGQDAWGAGDQCLHAGHANQIGPLVKRIRSCAARCDADQLLAYR